MIKDWRSLPTIDLNEFYISQQLRNRTMKVQGRVSVTTSQDLSINMPIVTSPYILAALISHIRKQFSDRTKNYLHDFHRPL